MSTPDPRILEDKRTYHDKAVAAGVPLPPFTAEPSRLALDRDLGRVTAHAFNDLKHDPSDPETRAAYDALKRETAAQFDHLVGRGVRFEPWVYAGQPYANSAEMARDARENRHLYYFPSAQGFGTDDRFKDHPLMEQVPGKPAGTAYNDLFRAVHDWFAHAMHGHQFGPQGELRAWHEHARMYSPLARKALTTETHGQNSWVNFGPHLRGDEGPLDKPFADQKAGVLPDRVYPSVKLAKKKAQANPEEEGFKTAIWKQWQAWRKHLADNERRGRPNVHEGAPPIMDDNARLVFADWLAERGDPREAIVRGHVEQQMIKTSDVRNGGERLFLLQPRNFGKHPETMHQNKLFHYDTIATDDPPVTAFNVDNTKALWDFQNDLTHPGIASENTGAGSNSYRPVPSVVWRHGGVTTSRRASGSGRDREHPVMFHAPVTTEQYLTIADTQPPEKRKQWYAFARYNGWTQKIPGEKIKLARLSVSAPKQTSASNPVLHHELHDEAGSLVGRLHVIPRDDGRHLHIQWVGGPHGDEAPNLLGAEAMRSVLHGLAGHYPDAQFVSGHRVSGFRGAAGRKGERVVVAMPRVKLARPDEMTHSGMIRAIREDESDATRRLAFADHLEETGQPGAAVVRAHAARMDAGEKPGNLPNVGYLYNRITHPIVVVGGKGRASAAPGADPNDLVADPNNAEGLEPFAQILGPQGRREGTAGKGPIILVINHRAHDAKDLYDGKSSVTHTVALHAVADFLSHTADFPKEARKILLKQALRHLPKPETPVKLARPQVVTGRGAAVREQGSDNHQQRLALAKQVLNEAGLRATVKSVLAHSGASSRPAVAVQAVRESDPQHALFAAAWLGLLTQEPAVTVFSPGEGQDALHVIDSPHPPDMVADYLRKSGVKSFTTEQRPAGTRVYAVNPDADMATIARGVHGEHSQFNGRADRIGGGAGSGAASGAGQSAARAGYRTVIRDAERAAGFGTGPAA